ncbi:hypothetical protein, partial [Kitasatospora sp. NPDC059800]|uniref:hypothetical protein n=1 Tax=Kitasatospora sp. NPDC059800 TaxID=3346951 RepID=UPI0036642F84
AHLRGRHHLLSATVDLAAAVHPALGPRGGGPDNPQASAAAPPARPPGPPPPPPPRATPGRGAGLVGAPVLDLLAHEWAP